MTLYNLDIPVTSKIFGRYLGMTLYSLGIPVTSKTFSTSLGIILYNLGIPVTSKTFWRYLGMTLYNLGIQFIYSNHKFSLQSESYFVKGKFAADLLIRRKSVNNLC